MVQFYVLRLHTHIHVYLDTRAFSFTLFFNSNINDKVTRNIIADEHLLQNISIG